MVPLPEANGIGLNQAETDALAQEIHQNLSTQPLSGPPEMEMQDEGVEQAGSQEPERSESGLDPDLEALQVQDGDSPDIAAEKQKLLRSYSKAMNKLHKGKKEGTDLLEGENIEELRRHSQLLQTLLQNPDSAQALQAVKSLTGQPQQQQTTRIMPKAKDFLSVVPKETLEFLNEEHREPMAALMLEAVEHGISKFIPYARYIEQLALQNQASSVDNVAKKYPALKTEEGKVWLDKARKYVNEKGMDLEEALFAVSRGKILAGARKSSDERVNGNISPRLPATSPKRTEPMTKQGPIDDDFKDQLAEEIMEIDRKEGTNRYFNNRIRGRR